ncbi:MAG: DUF4234 domain-containing protein [Candidatus Pacearchaeota archaeon]
MENSIKKIPQKKSVALLVFLSIITLGIYSIMWYIKRAPEINNLNTTKKLTKKIPVTLLILTILQILIAIFIFVLTIISIFTLSLGSFLAYLVYVLYGISAIMAILFLVVAFNFHSAINEVLEKKGTKRKLSVVFTIFFNYLYLQYELNRAIEDREEEKRTGPWIWFGIYMLGIAYNLYNFFLS